MLRIDLLPPYVHERRARPVFFGFATALVAAVIIAFVAWYIGLKGQLDQAKQQLDNANNLQSQYQDYQSKVQQVNSSIADIKSKQDFIASAQKYNDSWWKAYTAVASDTSPYILLHSMEIDPRNHNLVHLTGFCPNEMELARWWIFLRNDTAKFQSVYITMPAHPYPPEAANGQNGNQAYGGFGSYGPPKGMYGAGGSMGPMTSSPMSSSPYGMGGGPPGMPYGMSGMPGSPYGGYGTGGGSQNNGVATPTEIEGRKGLDFSADLVLQDSLAPPATPPTWPPAAQAGGAGAAGFGGYGMPPGMPGMPGFGPGGPMGSQPPTGSRPGGGATAPGSSD
ncbi:PilN domain-containing protein [Chthonomonas calidirosea]|uniref:PilN domain-containing protein n=1 Tax=Chthonomonas calidirosea TaxID=454171 RepID=UPI0006ECC703|nr:hypothetical protein [Chthonomonas calidirosea]CEK20240.1 hypothetical protein CP488_02791 [Chthonomonas calidirosea]